MHVLEQRPLTPSPRTTPHPTVTPLPHTPRGYPHKYGGTVARENFPIENGDLVVIAENQRIQKIKFKKLSVQYKDSLGFIVQQILQQKNDSNIRKTIKMIEKGA